MNKEKFLTREEAAGVLSEAGYPTTKEALATLAHKGTGPRYSVYMRKALYRPSDLITWAERQRTQVKLVSPLVPDKHDTLLTVKEVAAFFGGPAKPLTVGTIWKWSHTGKIPPPIKLGRNIARWRLSDCQEALEAMMTPTPKK